MAELFQEITRNSFKIKVNARGVNDGDAVCALDFDKESILGESETYEVILNQDELEHLFDQLGDIINYDVRRM